MANGFRNMPSYLITNEVHRRRDEIVGMGSGLGVAGKVCPLAIINASIANSWTQEFVLGLYEGLSGLVMHPYLGAKLEGPLGFPKGVGRGVWGLGCHTMAGQYLISCARGIFEADTSAAIWGVPGYTLKGIERALSKHRLTTLQAELYLIRLRQAAHDFERATAEERAEVVGRWKALQRPTT